MPEVQSQLENIGIGNGMCVLVILGANVVHRKEYLQVLLCLKLEFDILKL